jgi:hypothetical protein
VLAGCREGQDLRLTPALLRRQARARDLLLAAAALPSTDGGPADGLDDWLESHVGDARAGFTRALAGHRFAAATELLDELAERVLARYVAIRRAAGAGTPAWLLAGVAALFDPVLPEAAATLAAATLAAGGRTAGPEPRRAPAEAAERWMLLLDELAQLRGPVGLTTAMEIGVVLPEALTASLAAEPWIAHSTPLRLRLGGRPAAAFAGTSRSAPTWPPSTSRPATPSACGPRATRLQARLVEFFGVEVPIAELFERPTVTGLATRIEALLLQGIEQD